MSNLAVMTIVTGALWIAAVFLNSFTLGLVAVLFTIVWADWDE